MPVMDQLGGNIAFINVMNRLSAGCDCDGNPSEPGMHGIGILSSLGPAALGQACVDLVYSAPDGESVIQRIESRHGIHTQERRQALARGAACLYRSIKRELIYIWHYLQILPCRLLGMLTGQLSLCSSRTLYMAL